MNISQGVQLGDCCFTLPDTMTGMALDLTALQFQLRLRLKACNDDEHWHQHEQPLFSAAANAPSNNLGSVCMTLTASLSSLRFPLYAIMV